MTIIFAAIANVSPRTASYNVGDIAPVELPANVTVHSANHIGLDTADLARVLGLALQIGAHWRDQEGVNGALLDELAAVTAKAEPGPHPSIGATNADGSGVRLVEAPIWDRASINRQADLAAEDAATGRFGATPEIAESFRKRANEADGWRSLAPRSLDEHRGVETFSAFGHQFEVHSAAPPGEDIRSKAVELRRAMSVPLDRAVLVALAFGYQPTSLGLVVQPVDSLGERTVLQVDGVDVYEVVMTWPTSHTTWPTYEATISARWLVELKPKVA